MRRDLRSILLSAAVFSLAFFLYTISVYIAKKGGISDFTVLFLFGTDKVKNYLRYKAYTINKLGFMMAIGRYMTPFFLLLTAMNMTGRLKKESIIRKGLILLILPLLSIVAYIPNIFKLFSDSSLITQIVVKFSKYWIVLYIVSAIIIMIRELSLTKLSFFRIRFTMKLMIITSLSLIYLLFSPQDPAQVYLFYTNDYMWMMGLWYLHKGFSSGFYYVLILGSLVGGIISISSLIRYFSATFEEEMAEVKIRKESYSAARGVSMFVHGTKNDLLSSRILLEKAEKRHPEDDDLKRLSFINSSLVSRLENLNKTIKVNTIKLYPVTVEKVIEKAIRRTEEKYPGAEVRVSGLNPSFLVLADISFLSESLYNIMINGIEATREDGRKDALEVSLEFGRFWVGITISDRGKGIDKDIEKHIWEPFRSSKNSSTNWGIGMYYSRLVIKRHMGSITFYPRKDGPGTSFYVMLPLAGRNSND